MKLPEDHGEGDFFATGTLSEASDATRRKLFSKFWSNDPEKAQEELREIGDYRHYKSYEVLKLSEGAEPLSLGQVATRSGGQTETPFYLIRAAAYASALQLSAPGPHLRSVFLDEAFAKVDEPITRQILEYLSSELRMQVVFAMPTKSCASCLDLADAHYDVVRVPAERPIGELRRRILIHDVAYDPAQIKEFWERHRQRAREEAMTGFDPEEWGGLSQ